MRTDLFTSVGCAVTPLTPDCAVRVVMGEPSIDAIHPRANGAWDAVRAANPRAFDAPILALRPPIESAVERTPSHVGVEGASSRVTVRARRDRYAHLAVFPTIDLGVHLVAVRGIVIARDRAGVEHVLLGQRHMQTRIYGGRWEFGPSGGMAAPPGPPRTLEPGAILALYNLELSEEAGLDLADADARLVALCHDAPARGFDLVVRAEFRPPLEDLRPAERDWEYADVRWVPVREYASFARSHEISPPTRALSEMLAWDE